MEINLGFDKSYIISAKNYVIFDTSPFSFNIQL